MHFDHDQVRKGNYSSAAKELRRIWKQFREVLPRYGFGRHQLLPVKSEKGTGIKTPNQAETKKQEN